MRSLGIFPHQQQNFGQQHMHANMWLNLMHIIPFILVIILTLFSGSNYESRVFDLVRSGRSA